MCGRYALVSPPEEVMKLARLEGPAPNFPPRYNIAPTQAVAVVHKDAEGKGAGGGISFMRWGLVPHWSVGPDSRYSMINARAETIATKPAFRGPLRYRRCLVPANGFYEWKKGSGTGAKQPCFICFGGERLFFFAGVWDLWLGPDGSEVPSVAIVTTEARGVVRGIHDRMPVLLNGDEGQEWLKMADPGPAHGLNERLMALMAPREAKGIEARPVSRRVNNIHNDNPSCIAPPDDIEHSRQGNLVL